MQIAEIRKNSEQPLLETQSRNIKYFFSSESILGQVRLDTNVKICSVN